MPDFSSIVRQKFAHEPTQGQEQFFHRLDDFVEEEGNAFFILRGYAGTGKTSIIKALVQTLPLFNYKFVLVAPTGRAAKVVSSYAQRAAFTVHKIIYKQTGDPSMGVLEFKPQKNYHKRAIFIVDEASMLSVRSDFGKRGLLEDLVRFVFTHNQNKLLLIGDTAQLPPIGQQESAALQRDYYESFPHPLYECELDEVMRQEQDSGILFNATNIRQLIGDEHPRLALSTKKFDDIYRMDASRMEDGLRYAYDKYGYGNTIVITRSNKAAVNYNLFIRKQIHYFEDELEVGDIVMSVRNNYHYAQEDSPSGFIANGDFFEIRKILGMDEVHGFRFADLELVYVNEEAPPFEAKVLLDTIYSNKTSLSEEENARLYQSVLQDYLDIESRKARKEALAKDPYLNAIQIKFAYALTCHKAQGGQWSAVFVDQGFVNEDENPDDRLKWMYTAITRATDELFLLNFKPEQFDD